MMKAFQVDLNYKVCLGRTIEAIFYFVGHTSPLSLVQYNNYAVLYDTSWWKLPVQWDYLSL